MKFLPKGKKYNIRTHVNDKLKNYTVVQGGCAGDTYIYLIFENKSNNKCKIVKLHGTTFKMTKCSKALNIGHGNSVCIKNNILYITHSGTTNIIHTVNNSTLEKGKDIVVKNPKKYEGATAFNGIALYKDGFILRGMGSNKLFICDNHFVITGMITAESIYTSQDMATYNNQIIRAFSDLQSSTKNWIYYYNYSGKLLKKNKVNVTGELENIFIFRGKLYGTVYRKYKKNGKMKYCAYVFQV